MLVSLKRLNINEQNYKKIINDYFYLTYYICSRDISKITDKKFYSLLNKIYDITLSDNDMFEVLEDTYYKKYDKFITIATPMVFDDWEVSLYQPVPKYQYIYNAFVSDAISLEDNLSDMHTLIDGINKKDIVVASEYKKELNHNLDSEYEYVDFPKLFNNDSVTSLGFKISYDDKLFAKKMELLRDKYDNKKILRDLKTIILDICYQVEKLIGENNKNSVDLQDYCENKIKIKLSSLV